MIAARRESVPTTNASFLLIGPALLLWLAASASQARAAGGEACRVAPPGEMYARIVRPRRNIYLREAFWSRGAFFRAVGPALGSHLDNDPPEWGQGSAGYSRRAANRFGRFALQETYEAAWRHCFSTRCAISEAQAGMPAPGRPRPQSQLRDL